MRFKTVSETGITGRLAGMNPAFFPMFVGDGESLSRMINKASGAEVGREALREIAMPPRPYNGRDRRNSVEFYRPEITRITRRDTKELTI